VSEAAKVFERELVELSNPSAATRNKPSTTTTSTPVLRTEWDKDAANKRQALTDEFAVT